MNSWQGLENEVRTIATMTWGKQFHSELVHGRQIDAYARLTETNAVAIEVTEVKTIEKIQTDLNKLIHVRNANFSTLYLQTECHCVTSYAPTPAMLSVAKQANIQITNIDEFRLKYIPAEVYFAKRKTRPFGSAVDPDSGEKDDKLYTPVSFLLQGGAEADVTTLIDHLSKKRAVILTGEYGTGKSKCLEWIFDTLVHTAWDTFRFPLSIDLRKCWGLQDRYEIIGRHLKDLGLNNCIDAMVKAYAEGLLILLIDGFDEMGIQVWTDNVVDIRRLRSEALTGVRDLIANQRDGIIITGREHYFDDEDEMISALGLSNKSPFIIKTKEEFSPLELADFLSKNDFDVDVPEWLPRKPLTVELYMRIYDEIPDDKREVSVDGIQFWNMIIDAVCSRELKIHPSFDRYAIKAILIEVAAVTRNKLERVGPISLAEIQRAYENVAGTPIDQAGVLLQRLPGLGRTASDSQDRRFVDTYLLDGLCAEHIVAILERQVPHEVDQSWSNPLNEGGIEIARAKLDDLHLADTAINFCMKYKNYQNQTLLLDYVSCILANKSRVTEADRNHAVDFRGIQITGAYGSVLDCSGIRLENLYIEHSLIERLIISGTQVNSASLFSCTCLIVEGISSESGRPEWLRDCKIDKFSSVATTSRIRAAKLDPAQKVLVTILRKVFFQKGSGRKEEALTRGLGRLVKPSITSNIIRRLTTENILSETEGDEGTVYVPNRAQTHRVGKMIAELTFSTDPIWQFVSTL